MVKSNLEIQISICEPDLFRLEENVLAGRRVSNRNAASLLVDLTVLWQVPKHEKIIYQSDVFSGNIYKLKKIVVAPAFHWYTC